MAGSTTQAQEIPPYDNADIWIAVMGVTGAGKSSFISKCCDAQGIVGEDLDSFTKECAVYTVKCKGHIVRLIDTPGFNDTTRKDADVLIDIAAWLAKSYKEDTKLNGLIYLHGIHEARMKGSDMTNLRMFRKLTGSDNMGFVVLATSYWDVTSEAKGTDRENMLKDKAEFWKNMVEAGAKVMKFKNDKASAVDILNYIVDKNQKTNLKIQLEMSVDKKTVKETEAGLELEHELNKALQDAKDRYDEEQKELNKALEERNAEAVREALKAQDAANAEMLRLKEKMKSLDVDAAEIIRAKDEQIKRMTEETEKLQLEKQKTGEDFQRKLEEAKKEAEKEADLKAQAAVENFKDMLGAYLEGLKDKETSDQEQQQKTQESMEQMMRRLLREQQGDAATTRGLPPPYNASSVSPYPQPQWPPQQPQYSQADMSNAAATGTVAGAVGTGVVLTAVAASMCSVM